MGLKLCLKFDPDVHFLICIQRVYFYLGRIVFALPEQKKVMQGLGQCCLILYGSTPGMLQQCR